MRKPCILIAGQTVAADATLKWLLEKSATVLIAEHSHEVLELVREYKVHLILYELSEGTASEIDIIRKAKEHDANMEIILINGLGDDDLSFEVFSLGIKDRFQKPYRRSLIVERINAVLAQLTL